MIINQRLFVLFTERAKQVEYQTALKTEMELLVKGFCSAMTEHKMKLFNIAAVVNKKTARGTFEREKSTISVSISDV